MKMMVYWGSATVLSLVLLMDERPEVAGRQSAHPTGSRARLRGNERARKQHDSVKTFLFDRRRDHAGRDVRGNSPHSTPPTSGCSPGLKLGRQSQIARICKITSRTGFYAR